MGCKTPAQTAPTTKVSKNSVLKHVAGACAAFSLLLSACPGNGGDDWDAELLASYKRALPQKEALNAGRPGSPSLMMNAAVGDPAVYAPMGVEPTRAINKTVEDIVDLLDNVTSTDPSLYNSETQEFLWGPYDDDDSEVEDGQVYVYIKDQGEGHDFRYVYAFARGVGDDLSTFRGVIWGGANPGPEDEDYGSGITLWDFEANRAFVNEHNPDAGFQTEGRFVAVYGHGPSEDNPEHIVTLVAASFRNFKDREDDEAGDLDHLYGRVDDGENIVDFMDLEVTTDL